MRWHCYRHPQASQWLTANTANELSHLPPLLYSPSLFYFALAFSTEQRASVFCSASQYFIRLPHTLPLHFRNGCGNTSTEHTDSFQPAKKSMRHTSNNSLVQLTQTLNHISVQYDLVASQLSSKINAQKSQASLFTGNLKKD